MSYPCPHPKSPSWGILARRFLVRVPENPQNDLRTPGFAMRMRPSRCPQSAPRAPHDTPAPRASVPPVSPLRWRKGMRETAFRPTVQIGPSACLLLRPRWPVVPIMLAPGNGFRLRAVSRQAKPVTVLHLELRPKPHEKHQRKQFLPVGITPLSAPSKRGMIPPKKRRNKR